MKPWRFFILFTIVGIILLGAYIVLSDKKTPAPHVINTQDHTSPQQAIRDVIETNIAEAFQPSNYSTILDESSQVRLGFGKKFIDNYKMDWTIGDSYFLAFVGYDKSQDKKFAGYILDIYIPKVNTPNIDLAKIYLKNVPNQGWIVSPPQTQTGFKNEISTVIWKEQGNKLYLEVLSLSYKEPQSGYIPNVEVKDITVIRLLFYTPNNPLFNNVEEFQKAAHTLYGK